MANPQRFSEYSSVGQGRCASHFGLALTFILVGIGIGAATALLYAPAAGKKTRKAIRRRYEDVVDSFDDLTDRASDLKDRGARWARDAADRSSEWADVAREKVRPFAKAARKAAR